MTGTRTTWSGPAFGSTLVMLAVLAAAGRAAWTKLRAGEGEFTTFSGCLMGRARLREYATERLVGE